MNTDAPHSTLHMLSYSQLYTSTLHTHSLPSVLSSTLALSLHLGSLGSLSHLNRLSALPLLPPNRIQRPHPRQFAVNLVLLERDLVRLFRGRPEALDVKAVVEVRAEVVHPADGEEDVHAELEDMSVVLDCKIGERMDGRMDMDYTLNTSRFPPWSLRRIVDIVSVWWSGGLRSARAWSLVATDLAVDVAGVSGS